MTAWTTGSSWGLTVGLGYERAWVADADCRGVDPNLYDVLGQDLTAANEETLALCSHCPVRTACRDDYLAAGRIPLGLIAGGWWWDHNGRVHPHPDDVHLEPIGKAPKAPKAAEVEGPRPRPNGSVYASRRAITAARALLADSTLTRAEAAARQQVHLRALDDATAIARYAPDLLEEVWTGVRTLSSAETVAARRRNASRHLTGASR